MTTFAPRRRPLVFSIVTFTLALIVAFCAQPGLRLFTKPNVSRGDVFDAILPTGIGVLVGIVFIVYAVVATRWMVQDEESPEVNESPKDTTGIDGDWFEDEYGFWSGPDDWGQPEETLNVPESRA